MLFDIMFFGFPIAIGACFGALAVRDNASRFVLPAFSFLSYSLFYLVGGREIVLYLTTACMLGAGLSQDVGALNL